MRESLFETLIGAAVVAVAGSFLWFAIDRGGEAQSAGDQYEVEARFNNVSGISRGSDVRIAGVKAGIVKSIEGDPERFEAVVTLSLDEKWALPDDTDTRVSTDGLLGGAYVALEPGGSFDNIQYCFKNFDTIEGRKRGTLRMLENVIQNRSAALGLRTIQLA